MVGIWLHQSLIHASSLPCVLMIPTPHRGDFIPSLLHCKCLTQFCVRRNPEICETAFVYPPLTITACHHFSSSSPITNLIFCLARLSTTVKWQRQRGQRIEYEAFLLQYKDKGGAAKNASLLSIKSDRFNDEFLCLCSLCFLGLLSLFSE